MKLMKRLLLVLLLASFAFAQGPTKKTLPQPTSRDPELYPATADAKADIKAALAQAAKEKKNVLLDFGAVWCYDCHVLDLAFKQPEIKPLVDKNYVVVHVDVGRYDKNTDLATIYGVDLKKGVPGLSVLNSAGKVLYSQRNGEFESARSLTYDDVIAFLNKWKPKTPKK